MTPRSRKNGTRAHSFRYKYTCIHWKVCRRDTQDGQIGLPGILLCKLLRQEAVIRVCVFVGELMLWF